MKTKLPFHYEKFCESCGLLDEGKERMINALCKVYAWADEQRGWSEEHDYRRTMERIMELAEEGLKEGL